MEPSSSSSPFPLPPPPPPPLVSHPLSCPRTQRDHPITCCYTPALPRPRWSSPCGPTPSLARGCSRWRFRWGAPPRDFGLATRDRWQVGLSGTSTPLALQCSTAAEQSFASAGRIRPDGSAWLMARAFETLPPSRLLNWRRGISIEKKGGSPDRKSSFHSERVSSTCEGASSRSLAAPAPAKPTRAASQDGTARFRPCENDVTAGPAGARGSTSTRTRAASPRRRARAAARATLIARATRRVKAPRAAPQD